MIGVADNTKVDASLQPSRQVTQIIIAYIG